MELSIIQEHISFLNHIHLVHTETSFSGRRGRKTSEVENESKKTIL